jgi:hypothetical protein
LSQLLGSNFPGPLGVHVNLNETVNLSLEKHYHFKMMYQQHPIAQQLKPDGMAMMNETFTTLHNKIKLLCTSKYYKMQHVAHETKQFQESNNFQTKSV